MTTMALSQSRTTLSTSSSSSMSEEKEMIKQLAQLSSANEDHYSSKIIKEEVFAAQTARTLTTRFGTRGKSAKSIFLQGFRDEVMGRGKKHFFRVLHQHDPDDVSNLKEDSIITSKNGHSILDSSKTSSDDSSKIIIRPAAMVLYSKFCHRLEMLIKNQVFHLGLSPTPVETSWLYDEARQDSFKLQQNETSLEDSAFEVVNVHDLLDEPEEKMLLRLKIYKRALSALILHCEALRPLLREIKRSYDTVLKLRDRQLLEISWTTQNILTAQKEIEDKIQTVGFEGFNIITLMENQCKQLMKHIDKQDAAIRVMTDILNTLENGLGEQHELRRDSDDQNKMFVNDINNLRRKLGMSLRPEEGGEGGVTQGVDDKDKIEEEILDHTNEFFNYTPDDPLILRKSLDIARHDLATINKRLAALEEEHKDETPRHRFEDMKKDLKELEIKHEKLKSQTDDLQSQVQGTKEQIEKLGTDRNDLKKQAAELRLKITPRPSWEKVGEFVDGGVPKWKAIYDGKSSIEISNKVIEQLNAKKTASPPEYLTALGMDPEIPRCLRHDTRVRDLRLQRRDAEVIIQDIWKSRMSQLEIVRKMKEIITSTSAPTAVASIDDLNDDEIDNRDREDGIPVIKNFPEYVASYFEEKFSNVQRRMEWTYNLVDACKRLTMNQKLAQFQGVLMSRIDEGCYHLLRSELARLRHVLHLRSSELGHPDGVMGLGDFRKLIEQIYPHKNEDEIQALVRVTSKQTKAHADWTKFKYDSLFAETDEGFEGEFVDEFSKQLDLDRLKYVHEIIQGLLIDLDLTHYDYENREEDSPGDTEVKMSQFYKTLVAVDSEISDENIGATLAWVYTRTSTLPGLGPRGLPMVQYIKSHLYAPVTGGRSEEENQAVSDLEFQRALHELKANFGGNDLPLPPGEDSSGHQRLAKKLSLGQATVIKLRVLIRRLKEGAFMNHSTKIKTPPKSGNMVSKYPGEYLGEYDEGNFEGQNYQDLTEEEEDGGGLTTI